MSRPWDKRYSVRVTFWNTLVVQVAQYVPSEGIGDWEWESYRDAGPEDLKDFIGLIYKEESK